MAYSNEAAAFQVQERLRSVYSLLRDIEIVREKNEKSLVNVSKLMEKPSTIDQQSRLKALYQADVETEAEEDFIRKALEKIYEIRSIRNERRMQARNAGSKETIRRGTLMKMLQVSAQTLPLFVGKPDEKAPPLCGAVPAEASYIAKPGDLVAALVRNSEQLPDEEDNWILAEVVQFIRETNKYEVDDIDEEQKDRHVLSKRDVVPLPTMRANPSTDSNALFPIGSIVMALYPQTTCFYKAVVNQLPQTSTEEYELLFEDRSYPEGFSPPLTVAQRYVIAINEK